MDEINGPGGCVLVLGPRGLIPLTQVPLDVVTERWRCLRLCDRGKVGLMARGRTLAEHVSFEILGLAMHRRPQTYLDITKSVKLRMPAVQDEPTTSRPT